MIVSKVPIEDNNLIFDCSNLIEVTSAKVNVPRFLNLSEINSCYAHNQLLISTTTTHTPTITYPLTQGSNADGPVTPLQTLTGGATASPNAAPTEG